MDGWMDGWVTAYYYCIASEHRHGENILVDGHSGDCVHVDFDCLFGKGLSLQVPEVVPFRLTPNMTAAFGVCGVHGVYTVAFQHSLRVLRDSREGVMSVLQSFLFDPLIEWTRTGKQAAQFPSANSKPPDDLSRGQPKARQHLTHVEWKLRGRINFAAQRPPDSARDLLGVSPTDGTAAAEQRLAGSVNEWQQGSYSVESQTAQLIRAATCPHNLAIMYVGWMSWM
eukprot:GHVU01128564.1.p1 GENE.GHVU01128564.1~~GHVU01128564.1.p1  ORF type:complete len:226 (+),score=38.66 GHVU01128564.1:1-678(+)